MSDDIVNSTCSFSEAGSCCRWLHSTPSKIWHGLCLAVAVDVIFPWSLNVSFYSLRRQSLRTLTSSAPSYSSLTIRLYDPSLVSTINIACRDDHVRIICILYQTVACCNSSKVGSMDDIRGRPDRRSLNNTSSYFREIRCLTSIPCVRCAYVRVATN